MTAKKPSKKAVARIISDMAAGNCPACDTKPQPSPLPPPLTTPVGLISGERVYIEDLEPWARRRVNQGPAFDALVEAAREALSVCYGAKQCLGDIANISHAIKLLETALAQATEWK